MWKTILPMFFSGNLTCEKLICKSPSLFSFTESSSENAGFKFDSGESDEQRRISNRFSRILVCNAGFQVCFPGSRPATLFSNLVLGVANLQRCIADQSRTPAMMVGRLDDSGSPLGW